MTQGIGLVNKKNLRGKNGRLLKQIVANRYLYLLFLPAAVLLLLFCYFPMYGVIIAFKDYDYGKGIVFSPWTTMHGFQHFYDLLSNSDFITAFRNTIIISFQRLIFEFPVSIILALLINEIRTKHYKRTVQTVLTIPHFMSWVVVYGIFFSLLSDQGVLNQVIASLGFSKVYLLQQTDTIRGLLYITSNWKEMGWGTIIYLAAITGVDQELYEAAVVDGAKRRHCVLYITLPAIISVIGVMFILALANIMNAGFDQIFNMYNAATFSKIDIIDTYVYRRTFVTGCDYPSSAAIGLFKNIINLVLLLGGNTVVKKLTGAGIY